MRIIKVWAPHSQSVDLYCSAGNIAMERQNGGWWQCNAELNHGDDYGFLLDKEGPFPDPQSRWQPDGPHGLSRIFDRAFPWRDQDWQGIDLAKTVIYELHVGTFSEEGTFLGVIKHLDHLKALGITHIQMLPIAGFAGVHGWGYDGVNLFAPHFAYGTPEDLMKLVDACHHIGLGIILDVVYNHLGPSGNYLGQFGPYFQSQYSTPWGDAVNFDGFESPEVRRYFIDNALMWLDEFHFDGLRLDAVQTILDGSAIHFLEDLAQAVDELQHSTNRSLMLVAESHMNDSRLMHDRNRGGYGLQAQWHDDFHHAIYAYLTEENAGYFQDYGTLNHIAKVFNDGVYFDGRYCHYRRRFLGRSAEGLNGTNFVAYIQNHDQVGNRPGGERLSHLLNLEQLKLAAALLLTSPFIPMLFQGEEWGALTPFLYFTDHNEEKLGSSIKRGRRREAKEFGWPLTHFSDPQKPHSLERSRLDWSELNQPQQIELLAWYHQLLCLRQKYESLQAGEFLGAGAAADIERKILTIQRDEFKLLCNFSDKTQIIDWTSNNNVILLKSNEDCKGLASKLHLAPYSVLLVKRDI